MFDILKFQNPSNSNIYFEQSVAFNKYGDHNKGFRFLNQAVELNPKLHLGYRGYVKLRFLRDYDGALSDFNKLDVLNPSINNAPWGEDIDFLRGEIYYGKKNYQKAIDYFQRNIEKHSQDWVDIQSFVYIGICEYKLGNYDQAIVELHKALKQSDKTTEAYFYLSKTYRATDSLQKAKVFLAKTKNFLNYKRDDPYNEYLNEIYLNDIIELERQLAQ